MPAVNCEETALLSVAPFDTKDDIELKNIQFEFPSLRPFNGYSSARTEVRVSTDRGDILVVVQGNRKKPAILTYHDLGLNYISFQTFFNYVDMRVILENFCVYHVNAPGLEDGAPSFPEHYIYPTMDQLAHQINYVIRYFGVKSFIGFGVGAGANILARYAITHPLNVRNLTLINCTPNQAGWIEWLYQKMNIRSLRKFGMTQNVLDYLMWHHFGKYYEERNPDLVQMYRMHFTRSVNPVNLSLFIESYLQRLALNISRDGDGILVPVLNITGALSPFVDETVTLNGRLDPSDSSWLKISDCAMVLDEQPGKVSEAFRLFLQGEGYAMLSHRYIDTRLRLTPRMSFNS